MASGCFKVTKYFLFLFNLLFFVKISQVWQHLDVLILTPRVLSNGDANWEILVWTCQAWEILLSVNVVSDTSKYLKLQRAVKILYAQKWKEALTPTMEEWIKKTMGLILGAVILGFGIWILVDKTSFISVLQTSSTTSKVGAYILTGVGALTMLMGFLGCVGAVNEIRCLLGLYFTCLLLILIAQIAAGLLIYFQRNALEAEMSGIVSELVQNYNPYDDNNRTLENAWDYVQLQLQCCGWTGPETWKNNTVLQEKNQTFYPCSCSNDSFTSPAEVGFCPLDIISNSTTVDDWPVKKQGCMKGVQNWLQDNLGIILGVCTGVAVIELLGMVLSICLCKNIHTEDYTKVPKY